MIYYAAQLADKMTDALTRGDQAAFEDYDDKLGFYTPILKGFLTELLQKLLTTVCKCTAVWLHQRMGYGANRT